MPRKGEPVSEQQKVRMRETIAAHGGRRGAANQNWKGGTFRRGSDGREMTHVDGRGYVLSYRLRVETRIGRLLRDDEIIHHIDGDETNDADDNLQVMTQPEHARIHALERRDPGNRPLDTLMVDCSKIRIGRAWCPATKETTWNEQQSRRATSSRSDSSWSDR